MCIQCNSIIYCHHIYYTVPGIRLGTNLYGFQSSCSWPAAQRYYCVFPLFPSAPMNLVETFSLVPSRVSPPILHTQAESGALVTGSSPPSRFPRTASIHPYRQQLSIGPVRSLSSHHATTYTYRLRSAPRVRRHRAASSQYSSSNGGCAYPGRKSMDHFLCALSYFSHTH